MLEEITLIEKAVIMFTGLPSSVVGLVFSLGLVARSKYRKWQTEKQSRRERILHAELKRQLDFVYSEAYKDFESQIYYRHDKGETDIDVRHRESIDKTPFGAYKTSYKDALKEVAFKIVLPCIEDKLTDDKKLYLSSSFESYTASTGEDIRNTFIGALGRKVGTSTISDHVEEDTLTTPRFIELYKKIILRAREE